MSRSLTRRRALGLGSAALAGACTVRGAKAAYRYYQVQSLSHLDRDFTVAGTRSLRQRAEAKGCIFGAAARYQDLVAHADLAQQYALECSMLVPEWELKWWAGDAHLRSAPNSFDFTRSDWMSQFAQKHGMQLRGHALIWHLCLPNWFRQSINARTAAPLLTQHIQTVVSRYAGKIHAWDVVNEAIEPQDGRPDRLRNTAWLQFLGPDYIDLAFRTAAAADPNALLIYNDYGLEYDTPEQDAKRDAVLQLLEQLKANGTPIHGLGIQSHLSGHETRFNSDKFRRFLNHVARMKLKILLTELDVEDKYLPADISIRDRIVAGVYEDYLAAALDEPAVTTVTTWGLSDTNSWLSEFSPRRDRLPVRPLPLDATLNRKLAWQAIARCFDQCPQRS